MADAINNDMLEGKGTVNIDITTQGNSVSALKKALTGNASLSLADGAIRGIDIAGSIRDLKNKVNLLKAKDNVNADSKKKTDFSELTASFSIKNGVAHNEDLAMKAPILRLGKGDNRGDIDIANETINYLAKPTIVNSLKGQDGADLNALAGIAIPIKITGTFTSPKYGMDFAVIGAALAKSHLLDKVGDGKGTMVKDMLNGTNKTDALKGLLNKNTSEPAVPTTPANANDTSPTTPPTEAPTSAEDQIKEKAAKKLKNLLKF
jgi:AsmA protein